MSVLRVFLFDRPVGALERPDDQQPLDLRFTYASDYLADTASIPLSVSLPLRPDPYVGASARNWFANLLPEGGARQHLATTFGLTIQDDFGMLEAIGRECAGAVSLWPPNDAPATADGATRPLSAEHIEQWVQSRPRGAISGDRRLRLSLAGAQDKIGVVVEPDDSLSEPLDGAISSHILKASNPDYAGLISLEALGLRLARASGLIVPTVSLTGTPTKCLLVERFDREKTVAGARTRIHQEDFCQALGLPPEHKYQSHGGPSFAQCFSLVRELGLGAPALVGLLEWAAFNIVIANADAHGKNLGLLRRRDGTIELTPFYDLVPTGVYSARILDRDLAMSVGQAVTVDDVGSQHWQEFARSCGLAPRYVEQRVTSVVTRAYHALQGTADELLAEGAEQTVMATAREMIAARCDAMLSGAPLPKPEITEAPSGAWGMSL